MIVSGLRTTETPMKFVLQPWQLMLIMLARGVNREQQEVIEYLRTNQARSEFCRPMFNVAA